MSGQRTYLVRWDGDAWAVEAPAFGDAVQRWQAQMQRDDAEFRGMEPDSVELLCENATITPTRTALQGLVYIIDKAGLQNLSRGVQLGQTSWCVKASEALDQAREALGSKA